MYVCMLSTPLLNRNGEMCSHLGRFEDPLHFVGACGDAELSPLVAFDE